MNIRTLDRETIVKAPIDEVFDFFSRAENLERITPESLRFKILTPLPIDMRPGALIDYRLQLMGVPFHWVTEITVWEPGVRFADVQRKGPYLLWEHEHTFKAEGNYTRMADHLRYAVPGGPFEPLVTSLFVRNRVEQIFNFRETKIQSLFAK